jgi:8-oxo-dGTP pyrophosphatase MutT (NUDIX family)
VQRPGGDENGRIITAPFQSPMNYPFTVRVYGLLTHDEKILVCDEYYRQRYMTKFPGGGLQFGESPPQGLQREFMEELDLRIDVVRHFYTTDIYQPSAFDPAVQVISIYYVVQPLERPAFKTVSVPFAFPELKERAQVFRWIALDRLSEKDLTFPIDQKAARLFLQSRPSGRTA